jgi:hypothetical protein
MKSLLVAVSATALVVSGCVLFSGCDATSDLGHNTDAGSDAETSDAYTSHTPTSDAQTSDAGTSDGRTSDAHTSDAETSDAGTASQDAGSDAVSGADSTTADAAVDVGLGADGDADGAASESGANEASLRDTTAAADASGGEDVATDAPAPSDASDSAASEASADAGGADAAPDASVEDAVATDAGSEAAVGFDAASEAAASDASDAGEGDGSTCGTTLCYAGQSCIKSQCAFPCTGYNVPGDYSSVGAAVGALSSIGGTICIGAGTFAEAVVIAAAKPLVLQGVSADRTTVAQIDVTGGDVTLRGLSSPFLTIDDQVPVTATLTASKFGPRSSGNNVQIIANVECAVTFDGVEIAGSGGTTEEGVVAVVQVTSTTGVSPHLTVVMQNSYVHDVAAGFWLYANAINTQSFVANVTLLNNTFQNDPSALLLRPADSSAVFSGSLQYFNNILVGSQTAVTLDVAMGVQHGNNALFGNLQNYSGLAVDGPGYIKTDPRLDPSTSPPGLLPGSPCLQAADPSHAPAHDFLGRSRGAHPDVGAVQSSP